MVTGRLPFEGDDWFARIQAAQYEPLRQIDPKIPGELEAVCRKCLSKDVDKRYTTAGDLAEALRPSCGRRVTRILSWCAAAVLLALAAWVGRHWINSSAAVDGALLSVKATPTVRPVTTAPAMMPSRLEKYPAGRLLEELATGAPAASTESLSRPALALDVMARRAGQDQFVRLRNGERLASRRDEYVIAGWTFAPGYLYVTQIDASGKSEWLFPRNEGSSYSVGTNPLRSGESIQIPGPDKVLFLDDHVGQEHIYVVFSATRWPKLEQILMDLSRQHLASTSFDERPTQVAELRGVGGIRWDTQVSPAESLTLRRKRGDREFLLSLSGEVVQASGDFLVIERTFEHVASPE
jgi:hypothetical protein